MDIPDNNTQEEDVQMTRVLRCVTFDEQMIVEVNPEVVKYAEVNSAGLAQVHQGYQYNSTSMEQQQHYHNSICAEEQAPCCHNSYEEHQQCYNSCSIEQQQLCYDNSEKKHHCPACNNCGQFTNSHQHDHCFQSLSPIQEESDTVCAREHRHLQIHSARQTHTARHGQYTHQGDMHCHSNMVEKDEPIHNDVHNTKHVTTHRDGCFSYVDDTGRYNYMGKHVPQHMHQSTHRHPNQIQSKSVGKHLSSRTQAKEMQRPSETSSGDDNDLMVDIEVGIDQSDSTTYDTIQTVDIEGTIAITDTILQQNQNMSLELNGNHASADTSTIGPVIFHRPFQNGKEKKLKNNEVDVIINTNLLMGITQKYSNIQKNNRQDCKKICTSKLGEKDNRIKYMSPPQSSLKNSCVCTEKSTLLNSELEISFELMENSTGNLTKITEYCETIKTVTGSMINPNNFEKQVQQNLKPCSQNSMIPKYKEDPVRKYLISQGENPMDHKYSAEYPKEVINDSDTQIISKQLFEHKHVLDEPQLDSCSLEESFLGEHHFELEKYPLNNMDKIQTTSEGRQFGRSHSTDNAQVSPSVGKQYGRNNSDPRSCSKKENSMHTPLTGMEEQAPPDNIQSIQNDETARAHEKDGTHLEPSASINESISKKQVQSDMNSEKIHSNDLDFEGKDKQELTQMKEYLSDGKVGKEYSSEMEEGIILDPSGSLIEYLKKDILLEDNSKSIQRKRHFFSRRIGSNILDNVGGIAASRYLNYENKNESILATQGFGDKAIYDGIEEVPSFRNTLDETLTGTATQNDGNIFLNDKPITSDQFNLKTILQYDANEGGFTQHDSKGKPSNMVNEVTAILGQIGVPYMSKIGSEIRNCPKENLVNNVSDQRCLSKTGEESNSNSFLKKFFSFAEYFKSGFNRTETKDEVAAKKTIPPLSESSSTEDDYLSDVFEPEKHGSCQHSRQNCVQTLTNRQHFGRSLGHKRAPRNGRTTFIHEEEIDTLARIGRIYSFKGNESCAHGSKSELGVSHQNTDDKSSKWKKHPLLPLKNQRHIQQKTNKNKNEENKTSQQNTDKKTTNYIKEKIIEESSDEEPKTKKSPTPLNNGIFKFESDLESNSLTSLSSISSSSISVVDQQENEQVSTSTKKIRLPFEGIRGYPTRLSPIAWYCLCFTLLYMFWIFCYFKCSLKTLYGMTTKSHTWYCRLYAFISDNSHYTHVADDTSLARLSNPFGQP